MKLLTLRPHGFLCHHRHHNQIRPAAEKIKRVLQVIQLPTGSFKSLVRFKKPQNQITAILPPPCKKTQLSNKFFTKPVNIILLALVSPFDAVQNCRFLFIATHPRQVSEVTNISVLACAEFLSWHDSLRYVFTVHTMGYSEHHTSVYDVSIPPHPDTHHTVAG